MATYKLIPSSLVCGNTVYNQTNAYSDTESGTYAYATLQKSTSLPNYSYAFLGGFDWDSIPNIEDAVSITVKVKCYSESSSMVAWFASFANPYSNSRGQLSRLEPVGTSVWIRTFTLSYSVEDILPYLRTSCITFWNNSGNNSYTVYIYGAEIIVETTDPVPAKGKNKIMYGNQELIDLTSDTIDARDVRSGETFHLPSGVQSVGKLIPYIKTACATLDSSTAEYLLVFSNLVKEPSWFVIVCSCAPYTYGSTYRVESVVYNGSILIVNRMVGSASSTGGTVRPTDHEASFAYSDGVLTIRFSRDTGSVSYAEYTLYYL